VVSCGTCATRFGECNGAFDFMGHPRELRPDAESLDRVWRQVMEKLRYPERSGPAVRRALLATYLRTGIPHIDAEIASLPSRLGLEPLLVGDEEAQAVPHGAPGRRVAFVRDYIEASLPGGTRLQRTIRIRNDTSRTLRASGTHAWRLSYRWSDTRGDQVEADVVDSPLPVDIEPGRTISLAMTIGTPAKPGPHELSVTLSAPRASFLGRFVRQEVHVLLRRTIEVTDRHEAPPGHQQIAISETAMDYATDHADARTFVADYVTCMPDARRLKVMEVGAGIHPQLSCLAETGHTVVAADVCFNQAQLGALYFHFVDPRQLSDRLLFVTCDACEAPFEPGAFDGVAMFSTLHHIPEPESFLRKLHALVRDDDGFIAVLCEPCGPVQFSDEYRRDLQQGINEQVFTLDEYLGIFRSAGLQVKTGRLDAGSLKVILTRA